MRRFLKLLLGSMMLLTFVLVQSGAYATDPCPDAGCWDFTGTVTDPHGNPIQGITAWAKTTKGYMVTTTTDAAGRYEIHMPVLMLDSCPWVGTNPNDYYTGDATRVKFCEDAVVDLHPLYRVSAEAPVREQFFPDTTKPITFTLRVYVNALTKPAPFAGDPLTWTLTNHEAGSGKKTITGEGVFQAPTATKTSTGTYRYVWTATLTATVDGPTMVHVDWGRNTVFGQMMDCRMLFVGIGITSVTPSRAAPGQPVTVEGMSFGTKVGKINLSGAGYGAWINPATIIEWTPTRVTFLLPLDAKNSVVRLYRADGSNAPCLGGGSGAPTQKFAFKVIPG